MISSCVGEQESDIIGRRGGSLSTTGSFTLSSESSNRAGNSEDLGNDLNDLDQAVSLPNQQAGQAVTRPCKAADTDTTNYCAEGSRSVCLPDFEKHRTSWFPLSSFASPGISLTFKACDLLKSKGIQTICDALRSRQQAWERTEQRCGCGISMRMIYQNFKRAINVTTIEAEIRNNSSYFGCDAAPSLSTLFKMEMPDATQKDEADRQICTNMMFRLSRPWDLMNSLLTSSMREFWMGKNDCLKPATPEPSSDSPAEMKLSSADVTELL